MKKTIYIIALAVVTLACSKKNTSSDSTPAEDNMPIATNTSTTETTKKEEVKPEETVKSEEIEWLSYDDAVKASKKKPKKIFVDVYTDWCGWCKKMEKGTLKDGKISSYMNKKYYAVKLNAESDKLITYQGKQMKEKDLAGRIFKITGYPSTVYLEPSEKLIQAVPGYMDVPTLDKILHYIGEDAFKTQTWEQFQMSYTE